LVSARSAGRFATGTAWLISTIGEQLRLVMGELPGTGLHHLDQPRIRNLSQGRTPSTADNSGPGGNPAARSMSSAVLHMLRTYVRPLALLGEFGELVGGSPEKPSRR
jgi:hypothetical protein